MSVDDPSSEPVDHRDGPPARSPSRLPKTNRADHAQPAEALESVPVTLDDGTKLRDESLMTTPEGERIGLPMGELRRQFRAYILDRRESRNVFRDGDGDRFTSRHLHSFTTEYQERQCARAHDLERGLRDEWGTTVHTAMLTLTCSKSDEEGRLKPPLDHLNELLASWEAVRRELSRVLDGREWERLAILEPHKSGYTHIHVGVFVRGPIDESEFRPVIEAHLRNCPGAGREAHEQEETIKVRHTGDPAHGGIDSLGSYLTAYMTHEYGESVLETPEYLQYWYALMWVAPVQRFRASNGAQELMAHDGDGSTSSTVEFVGIAPDGDLDEVHECDGSGGVEYGQVCRHDRPPPPD